MFPERTNRPAKATWLVAASALVAALEIVVAMAPRSLDAGLLQVIRTTARTSVVWFVLAFAASPLVALRPSPWTKWLLRNRRSLGLAMAVSHGVHLISIVALAVRHGSAFWNLLAPTTLIGGGLGYVVLAAMVATSNDRGAAWLGRWRWRALHLTGMWFFWLIFTSTYAGQISRSPIAAAATSLLLAVALLRVMAALRRGSRRRRT